MRHFSYLFAAFLPGIGEQAKAGDYLEEFVTMRYWLSADTFDCQVVNDRLALYTVSDERGLDADQEVLHP